MSKAKGNGPAGKRSQRPRGNTNQNPDLQATCARLSEQVQQVTKERDSLKNLVALLQSKDEEDFYAIVRMIRDEITKGKSWNPADEKDWLDFGKLVKELECELESKHASGT